MALFRPEEDGGKIKPPNYQQVYTSIEQIVDLEMCEDDYMHFITNHIKIPNKAKSKPGAKKKKKEVYTKYIPYDYQTRMYHNFHHYDRVITMVGRQSGKTMSACIYILWYAMFNEKVEILIASNKGDSAKECIAKIKDMYMECPWFVKCGLEIDNVHTLKFDNGSRIRAETTTPDTGRGSTIDLLYLDEFAYVKPSIQKDLWRAIQPTLAATNGKLIITSTPNTDEDKFANIWFSAQDAPNAVEWKDEFLAKVGLDGRKKPKPYKTVYEKEDYTDLERIMYEDKPTSSDEDDELGGFYRMFIHWKEHPNRDEKFKTQTLREGITLSEWYREYECRFVSKEETLIEATQLLMLNLNARNPRYVDKFGARWFCPIRPNQIYGVTLDPSEGVGEDRASIQVWELPQLRQVAEWTSNEHDQLDQAKQLVRFLKTIEDEQYGMEDHMGYSECYYTVEANGVGKGILNIIEEDEDRIPGTLVDSDEDRRRGILTTKTTKKEYCMMLKLLIERKRFVPFSRPLITELKSFVKRGSTFAAKSGAFDDRVMACVQMLHMIDLVQEYEPDLEDAMKIDIMDAEADPEQYEEYA